MKLYDVIPGNEKSAIQVCQWFVVSPAPASGRPCSLLSLAGCHFCPDCLGYEEPRWRQPSPWPEPEESPLQLCPWSQRCEEVRWNQMTKAEGDLGCEITPVELKASAPGGQRKGLSCSGVKCPLRVASWLTSVVLTSSLGLLYTSRSLAGNPQESWRKMLLYEGEQGTGQRKRRPLIWDLTRSI